MSDSIFDKIHFLVRYLNECTVAYDNGNPIISDEEWDKKYFELKKLEEDTGLILGNSPTQSIHYDVVNALEKVEHNHKMLSLEKTKELNEIIAFLGRKNYVAMCKMDGLTCSLTYRDGNLVAAETRGNGLIGENILHNAMVIPSIPKHIPIEGEIVIDGEIICTLTDFEIFASDYKNPRNFAAGSIRLLDAKECSKRKLTFVAWEVIKGFEIEDTFFWRLNQLQEYGFTVVPNIGIIAPQLSNSTVVDMQTIINLQEEAKKLGYPIDGIVFKFDDIVYGQSLGETSHHFKNAMAYKFYDETYPTALKSIEWTMGRTGVLTPVAVFEPIDIDGSTVERASLHNISVMEELSGGFERIGDILYIFKANQIIPQVSTWEHVGEYSKETHLNIPTICPICGGETAVKMDNESKMLICTNPNCAGKLINKLDHFCGKKGMDIKGLSKATLEKLINWGYVNSCSDIFTLNIWMEKWINKPGFGVKSVDKILTAIESSRHCELHQFIAALGIPLIGTTASKQLTKVFKTWNEFIEAVESGYKFYHLDNFGLEMHQAIVSFNYNEAKYIADNYLSFNSIIEENTSQTASLEGMTFVITGKLTHFKNRDAIKDKIESLGGKVTGSVSKNTNYLINNDVESTSSKNKTAKSLGIPILSENDFIQTFGIE